MMELIVICVAALVLTPVLIFYWNRRKSNALDEYNKTVGGILEWGDGMKSASEIAKVCRDKVFDDPKEKAAADYIRILILKNCEDFVIDKE